MARIVKIYLKNNVTCVDVTENGNTKYFSSSENRSLKVISGGVQILPNKEDFVLNNFKILLDELEDNFEATTPVELRDKLLERNFFKKGGGGVTGGENLEEFVIIGTTLGRFNDGDTVPAHSSNNERWKDIGRNKILPTFNLPVASIVASIPPNNSTEVGTTLENILLTASLTQNDGGVATNYKILKDNVNILNHIENNSIQQTFILSKDAIQFKAIIDYAEGTNTKEDNFGYEIENPIIAGNDESNILNFIGYYPVFFGSTGEKLTESNSIRAGLSKRLENSGNTFTLNTGSENTIFQLWLPTGKILSSVTDLDALNAVITSSYVEEDLIVNNANGNPINGKLYTMTQGVPYSNNHRHQITITNE